MSVSKHKFLLRHLTVDSRQAVASLQYADIYTKPQLLCLCIVGACWMVEKKMLDVVSAVRVIPSD